MSIALNPKLAIAFMIDSVAKKPAAQAARECRELGMEERPYIDVPGLGMKIDKGYHFTFPNPEAETCFFELLQSGDDLLQAKLVLFIRSGLFRSMFSPPGQKAYVQCATVLEMTYGSGSKAEMPVENLYFTNNETNAYITRSKQGPIEIVTTGVGNRAYWG